MINAGNNNPPKAAMILAAGLGIRMQPLTNDRPKAMVEIFGKPLIGHMLDHFSALDPSAIVVNVHYKPAALIAYLKAHPLADKIIISDEQERLLDTGGGVLAALPHFDNQPFFVANCDSFFPSSGPNPVEALTNAWSEMDAGALLLVKTLEEAAGYSGSGDFSMAADSGLQRRGEDNSAPYVFTGFQILTLALFTGISERVFSLNKIYDQAQAEDGLCGVHPPGPWFHIGTPDTLAEAEATISP